jgi:hypothetical protein
MPKQSTTVSIPKLHQDGQITRTRISDEQPIVFEIYSTAGVDVSYAQIVEIFGSPTNDGNNEKIDAQWIIETPNGIAILHNLKNGRNFLGPKAPSKEDITEWCIRGTQLAIEWIQTAFCYYG